MNTINHALWGITVGRKFGLAWQGGIAGALPDLITLLPFGYFSIFKQTPPERAPKLVLRTYRGLHNWWFGIGLTLILYFINPLLIVLGGCYVWHIIEDAFVHTKMATKFLYPIWKGKIQKFSAAENKLIQVGELLLIVFVNWVIGF